MQVRTLQSQAAAAAGAVRNIAGTGHPSHIAFEVFGPGLLTSCHASSWLSAAAGYSGLVPGSTSLQGMCIASNGGPLGQLNPVFQPCLHVIPRLSWRSPMYIHRLRPPVAIDSPKAQCAARKATHPTAFTPQSSCPATERMQDATSAGLLLVLPPHLVHCALSRQQVLHLSRQIIHTRYPAPGQVASICWLALGQQLVAQRGVHPEGVGEQQHTTLRKVTVS